MKTKKQKIIALVFALGWETDRMSRDGSETWEELWTLVGGDISESTDKHEVKK